MVNISRRQIYAIGTVALLLSAIQQVIFLTYKFIFYFGFVADVIIVICAIIIRFKVINVEDIKAMIRETDVLKDYNLKQLNPSRFLNGMLIAIIIGTIASITIHYNNVLGVLLFLIMHIIHIWAFSGIIHFKPKALFGKMAGSVRKIAFVSTICFIIIMPILYFSMIYPGQVQYAIGILFYMIILVFMTLSTYWALGYTERPLRFRIMLCLGASLFFFSDLMIGYNTFTNPFYLAPLFIFPTWIGAIFLMQFAILELKIQSKDN